MAAHSTVLAWEIPGTEEPWGHKELDTTKRLNNNPRTPCPSTHTHIHSNISPSLPRIQLKSGIFHLIKDNNYMQYTVWHTVHAQLMVATVNSIIFFFLTHNGTYHSRTAHCHGGQIDGVWEAKLVTTALSWIPSLCQELNCHLPTPPHLLGLPTTQLEGRGAQGHAKGNHSVAGRDRNGACSSWLCTLALTAGFL